MPVSVTRWDPSAEFGAMRNLMDRLFDQSVARFPSIRTVEEAGASSLNLDVFETGESLVVKAAVPGIAPDDLDIQVEDGVLTIRGSFEQKDEAEDATYLRRELVQGSFARTLRLPPTIDPEKAHAEFEHGMLKLTLPKKPEARARSIKITVNGVVDAPSATPGD